MSEVFGRKESKKQAIKDLIKKLHAGAKPDDLKEKFKDILQGVGPADIAQIEEELIREGMPREEIHRLCDVHLAVFRESLGKEKAPLSPGHPVQILMEEHKIILQFAGELKNIAKEIKGAKDFSSVSEKMEQLKNIAVHFKDAEKHYVREENVLFPYVEKHGITEPPAIMWMEHDKIREMKKNLYKLLGAHKSMRFKSFAEQLEKEGISLSDMLSNHFYKENNILFPAALQVIGESEWKDIRQQFDELGYCCFTPEYVTRTVEKAEQPVPQPVLEGMIDLETGALSKMEMETILNTLPVDVTFVDDEDTVRYFSQSRERIFPRTKAVIGRKVQQCHPQKSIHVVNQILDDFRNSLRDVAEFWIRIKERLVYIRYFAVRDKDGKYLGCLEVTQDITDIKKIEGEKRLL